MKKHLLTHISLAIVLAALILTVTGNGMIAAIVGLLALFPVFIDIAKLSTDYQLFTFVLSAAVTGFALEPV